jgi:ribonuclease HI
MLTIYTDGAARNNPGKAGWGVVIVDLEKRYVVELGGASPHATNNQMELTGAIKALEYISVHKNYAGQKIALHTDSSYVVQGMKQWVYNWQKNGWQTRYKKDVENVRLWKDLVSVSQGKDIEWVYVRGHSGVPLNERTDIIATEYADHKNVTLFSGILEKYPYDVSVSQSVKLSSSKQKKTKTGYYVVLRQGEVSRYDTWADCELVVKGVKNVRFKKVADAAAEKIFLDSLPK